MKERITQFIKFCIVGGFNTILSLGIYYILLSLSINYLISITTGYIVSSICGYFLSKIWVFGKKQNKIKESIFKYYSLYGSSLILNLFCMYTFVQLFKISDFIAPIITIIITTIYNFIFSKIWVFNKNKNQKSLNLYKKDKVFIGLFLSFIILIGCVFINNIYNHPTADDYSNFNSIIAVMPTEKRDDYNLGDLSAAAVNRSIQIYQNWQGTYFANILFSMNPLFISLNAYRITMIIIQIFWLVGTWFFFRSFSLKNPEKQVLFDKIYLSFIVFSILSMYSLGEGLYWFTGSILYIIPFTISLIFFGLIMRYLHHHKKSSLALIITLAIILGGTSYVTGLVVGFALLLSCIYYFIYSKPEKYTLLTILIIFCIGFALNVFCPGNFIRTDHYEKIPLFKALIYAAINAFDMLKYLLFNTLFIPLVLIIFPSLLTIVKKCRLLYQKPALLSILCTLCYISTFIPMSYAYGSMYQETRVQNIQLLYLAIMIIICLINYLGSKKLTNSKLPQNSTFVWLGILSLIIMIAAISPKQITGFNLIDDLLYSRSSKFDNCMDYNHELLISGSETVELSNCEIYPSSLHYSILHSDSWQTEALQKYYNTTIIVKGEQ